MKLYNKKLKNISRTLRKEMTEAEKLFWSRVRRKQLLGYNFIDKSHSVTTWLIFTAQLQTLLLKLMAGNIIRWKARLKI